MNVVLCPNEKRDRGLAVTEEVRKILISAGARVSICPFDTLSAHDLRDADSMVTFGGDGTILHAARIASVAGVPLLGVNLGNKGFIAELEPENIQLLGRLPAGDYTVESRMMMDITVTRRGEQVYSDFALNDVFMGGMAKVVDISVYGEGIVVATPTGSTAYSLSAGGPIVEPDGQCLVVTPICPHVLWAKAYVLTATRVVTVRLGSLGDKIAYLSADGSEPFPLSDGDEMTVRRSGRVTRLIRLTDKSFYERVSEKLGVRV